MIKSLAEKILVASIAIVAMNSCATSDFRPSPPGEASFVSRAITQEKQSIAVSASVPSPEEVVALFGIDLYADDIQPVWLHIENNSQKIARVALISIDQDYYSPIEVAWNYRKRFARNAREGMQRWFVENALPRRVSPGESRSGFIFTHRTIGTKGFNVDLFTDESSINYTFFVPLPGFRPDYMDVEFLRLYEDDEITRVDNQSLRQYIDALACCTSDESGQLAGDPLNVVIIGTPQAVRRSLLRGGWQETESGSEITQLARSHFHRGRPPDGTFHKSRPDGSERKELRLWLQPALYGDETLWLGHVSYDMSGSMFFRDLSDYQLDPDVDDARMFLLQNFWYNQSLRSFAMAGGVVPATIDSPRTNFHGREFFTDGLRAVLFVAENPVAMDETEILIWEPLRED